MNSERLGPANKSNEIAQPAFGVSDMKDCPPIEDLYAFACAELVATHQDGVATHVSVCESCRQQLDQLCLIRTDGSEPLTGDRWNSQVAVRIANRLQLDRTAIDRNAPIPPDG